MKIEEGVPYPFGAIWDCEGTDFALSSAYLIKVDICLFESFGGKEIGRTELTEYLDQVVHGFLPDIGPGIFYGFGPSEPQRRHRFNPYKLLLESHASARAGGLDGAESKGLRIPIDSNLPARPAEEVFDPGQTYELTYRSLLDFGLEGARPFS